MSDSKELLEKLTKRTIEYTSQHLGMDEIVKEYKIESKEIFEFLDISAKIELSGYIEGFVVLSVSKELALELADKSTFNEIDESILKELKGESIAEILNIVLGNILRYLDGVKQGKILDMSAPKITKTSYIVKDKKEILVCMLSYKSEKIILSYFI